MQDVAKEQYEEEKGRKIMSDSVTITDAYASYRYNIAPQRPPTVGVLHLFRKYVSSLMSLKRLTPSLSSHVLRWLEAADPVAARRVLLYATSPRSESAFYCIRRCPCFCRCHFAIAGDHVPAVEMAAAPGDHDVNSILKSVQQLHVVQSELAEL